MQANQTKIIWAIILSVVVLLFAGYFAVNYTVNQIPESPVIPEITIPTAAEVAAEVNALIVVQDIPDTWLSLRDKLKSEALAVCDEEFDMDDLLEDVRLSSQYDDDEVSILREYDNRNFYNINLGIDFIDDRTMTIERSYKLDFDDDYKDKVYVTCHVTSDDGELEADIDYNL